MLYWAALFDKVPIEKMLLILNELEAYPEGPVAIDKWKTPCHAAAQAGNVEKLKELMSDINARYNNVATVINGGGSFKKINICDNFDAKWEQCLKMPRFKHLSIFYNTVF